MDADTLRRQLGKLVGADTVEALIYMDNALHFKERFDGDAWTDYMFVAACYFAAAENEGGLDDAVRKIKEENPDYNPSQRFSHQNLPAIDPIKAHEDEEEAARLHYFSQRAVAIDQMRKFYGEHPDFDFGEALGDDFPGASQMEVLDEELPGVASVYGQLHDLRTFRPLEQC